VGGAHLRVIAQSQHSYSRRC